MSWGPPPTEARARLARAREQLRWVQETGKEHDWFLLSALAAETTLGWSVLRELGVERVRLDRWRRDGIVVDATQVRPLSIVRDGPSEPGFSLRPELVQLVLRKAQQLGVLGPATLATEETLGSRSTAALVRKLQAGSLIFRPGAQQTLEPHVTEALCNSVLEPFDEKWFETTWKKRAPRVAEIIIRTCLLALRPCEDLFEWALRRQESEHDEALAPLLVSYGLHQMQFEKVEPVLRQMEFRSRSDLRAVERFLRGDPRLAVRLLQQDLKESPKQFPPAHPFSPLLALLLATDESLATSDPRNPADWLRTKSADESGRAIRKALQTFLRYRDEPEDRLRRLDPHPLTERAPAFQILLLGLATYAFVEGELTRAAWADRLTRWGAQALRQGFLWMGRQGLVLAVQMDRSQASLTLRELATGPALPVSEEGLRPQPGDLASFVQIRSPWEVQLAALERLSTMDETPDTKHRIRWYVDAASGTVQHPGLLRFEKSRGWILDRRLPWAELLPLVDDLGEQDRRVLQTKSQHTEDDAFPHLEILDRLVAHPRVVDGAQGEAPLEITRQHLRIETFDEAEHLRIGLRPENLGPGLNLVRLAEDRLCVVEVQPSMNPVLEALGKDLLVPHAQAAQVLTVLSRLSSKVPVKSAHLDGEVEVSAVRTPTLRFSPKAGAYLVEIGVRPFGSDGRFFPPGSGPAVLSTSVGGRRKRTTRALREESDQVQALVAASPTLLSAERETTPQQEGPAYAWILGEREVLDLLSELRDRGQDITLEWPEKSGLRLAGAVSVGALRGALCSKKGWYLLSGSLAIDEVSSLTLAELTRVPFVHGGRYVRLKNGDYLSVDQKVRRLGSLISGAKIDAVGQIQLGPARLLAIRSTLEGAVLEIDGAVRKRLRSLEASWDDAQTIPAELNDVLRPYQREGLAWLNRLCGSGFGALLADDMGLGKTLQVIGFLATRPQGSHHLVVAPLSVCTNWAREIARFSPGLVARPFSPGSDPSALPDVTIVSFSQLAAAQEELARVQWDTVVVDEAQFIKNPKTQRAQAIFPLKSVCRIATTGTPVENHLGDLWGIFRFLNPDLLGAWSAFHTHFVKPIERDGDAEQRRSLQEIVRPFILRRTKDQVLTELPPLTRIRKAVHLSEDEVKRYALLRRQIHEKLRTVAGRQNHKLEILAEITRLRRFCCHPRLVFPDAPDDSPKLRALIALLQELRENGHQALVFSQYVDFLASVRERLSENELPYVYLDGSSSQTERQQSIDHFNSGQVPIFVISLKAGGVGLNLTAADYVIHLDPWWNPAVTSQATDRAHRIGQEQPVTSYELFTKDTIEEDILQLHESKRELSRLVEESAQSVATSAPEELREWLETSLARKMSSGLAP